MQTTRWQHHQVVARVEPSRTLEAEGEGTLGTCLNLRAHLASNRCLTAVWEGLLGFLWRGMLGRDRCWSVDADGDAAVLLVIFFRHGGKALALFLIECVLLTSSLLFSVCCHLHHWTLLWKTWTCPGYAGRWTARAPFERAVR